MNHERHYTLDQATAALPWVRERLERLRESHALLNEKEARDALEHAAPGNGGGEPGQVVSEGFLGLRSALIELQEMEIVLRDLERGLVDFPSLRDGREVYLCWVEQEEDEIAYWHELETGFAGRQPL
ncbi:MAG TPA: DUF2203 domain-containing protein [Thermoleophilaceae bacterium]